MSFLKVSGTAALSERRRRSVHFDVLPTTFESSQQDQQSSREGEEPKYEISRVPQAASAAAARRRRRQSAPNLVGLDPELRWSLHKLSCTSLEDPEEALEVVRHRLVGRDELEVHRIKMQRQLKSEETMKKKKKHATSLAFALAMGTDAASAEDEDEEEGDAGNETDPVLASVKGLPLLVSRLEDIANRLEKVTESFVLMSRQLLPRVFSGIQPTGSLHLGNYFGAVRRWVKGLDGDDDKSPESRLFSVVDLHAITMPQDCKTLRANTLSMTAALLACGLDHTKCILFQQSAVAEHTELAWILGCLTTLPQLAGLSQYKEKSSKLKEVPLGLFSYPVLQSADILLYKATEVPVGEDNLQNVQVAQQLCKSFNRRHGNFFPKPKAVLVEDDPNCRVRSLRDPLKKMSKSDPDWRGCIYVRDGPDVVLEKCKKAVTDFTSAVTFDLEKRPGVSNLISIHCGFTGQTPDEVCREVEHLTTAQYKLLVADVINDHLRPIKERMQYYDDHREHLLSVLESGAEKARTIASDTMRDVKKLVGFS